MKQIAIDARQLGSKQSSGIGVVTQELINNIVSLDDSQYTVFTSSQLVRSLLKSADNLTEVSVSFPFFSVSEQISYPGILNQPRFDLIHYTNFNTPIFSKKNKNIVTVYDLIPWLFPGSPRQKNWFHQWFYRLILKRSCQQANRIITISNGTKMDLIKYLKISPEKIDVIYPAVSQRLSQNHVSKTASTILSKYNIEFPYFLYVGQWRRHKNLSNLLKAFADYVSDYPTTQLVIVGKEDPHAPEILAQIQELNLASSVIITGYIPDDEIGAIYKNALAFVFPSFYEGFGMPPLEAMSVGVPVISSNASVMPEVLGDAAVYFDPHNTTEIVQAMKDVTSSSGLNKQLIEKGYQQVKKYSYLKMAQATLAVYKKVLAEYVD
jgi:glycosyltransferase involved in cell wall biosynthesis